MQVLEDGDGLKAYEKYRTAWFGEDGMIIDSPNHRDAWWRDETNKTLPAQTVRPIFSR